MLVGELWQVILGTAIVGAGTGIGYATLPTLINSHTPAAELAAANGINTLARSLGSTLASAIGGTLLASITMDLGGVEVPSLGGLPRAVRHLRRRLADRQPGRGAAHVVAGRPSAGPGARAPLDD